MGFESYNALALLFGGLAFFMYGMSLVSDHLQKIAANKIRELFRHISGKKYLAIVVGIFLTIFLQSSGAVTSMLVGLGSARVVTLQQVMAIIVGTAIGSTFTVQVISFKVVDYGMLMFILGFFSYFVAQRTLSKNLSGVVMGFGMLFIGLQMMGMGTDILKKYDFIQEMFVHLNQGPLLTCVVTALFTALVHSSAVTIGLAMSLATSGILTFEQSLYWVYGANVGTTATALMASVGSNYIGRQVAWAHFFYKTGTFLIFFFLTNIAVIHLLPTTDVLVRDIANAHTFLNIVSAIIFYPLIDKGAQFIERIIPKSDKDKEFGPEFINSENFQHPELAYAQARREAMRMGDIVSSMMKDSLLLFKTEDPDLIASIRNRDNQVDILQREIKMFLARMSTPTAGLNEASLSLITFVSDLEGVGDVIDNGIMELARKKNALKLEFSQEGWKEICQMHNQVMEIVQMSLSCFEMQDRELANRVIQKKRDLRKLEKQLKESHIDRLKKGLTETINTSSIHMDLISDYRRISGLIVNHAYNLSDLAKE